MLLAYQTVFENGPSLLDHLVPERLGFISDLVNELIMIGEYSSLRELDG